MIIQDGTGNGYSAGVNAENKLLAQTESVSELATISKEKGEAYYLKSGFIALTTTASFSGIFYLKNASTDKEIAIHQLRTCGTVVQEWDLIKNPTAGTLISAGTASVIENVNTGSSKTLGATALDGADALTVTDGNNWAQWINGVGHSTAVLDGALILAPGDALALTCKPAAAGDVCVTIIAVAQDGI